MYKDIKITVSGEKVLFKEIVKILPLIEKHFKSFDSKRARLASGGKSAIFEKVVKAFKADCESVSDNKTRRLFVETSDSSVRIDIDIHERDLRSDFGVNYFKYGFCVGAIDAETGNFTYDFNQQNLESLISIVLSYSVQDLQEIKRQHTELKQQIKKLQNSLPYPYRDILERI